MPHPMTFWVSQIFNGISYGALLFLLAGGLSLIFGMMRIVNMTHGSYYLLGGYVALSVIWRTQRFWLAVIVGALAIALGLQCSFARGNLVLLLFQFGLFLRFFGALLLVAPGLLGVFARLNRRLLGALALDLRGELGRLLRITLRLRR